MKKLLFLFMMLLSLCSCSSDDGDKEIRNVFTVDGKSYSIDKARYTQRRIYLYSGDRCLWIYNIDYELGKKCYLSSSDIPQATIMKVQVDGNFESMELNVSANEVNKASSYVWIKESEDDNRTYIEVYINSKYHEISARYLGTAYKN